MGNSEDNRYVEEGVLKFLEWLKTGKLEIKAYPTENIHAKLYIMTFSEGDRDIGRIITGASNFTQAGLVDNLEFNVELKNSINPLKLLAVLQKNIPSEFLKEHISESAAQTFGPREVILSEYLIC